MHTLRTAYTQCFLHTYMYMCSLLFQVYSHCCHLHIYYHFQVELSRLVGVQSLCTNRNLYITSPCELGADHWIPGGSYGFCVYQQTIFFTLATKHAFFFGSKHFFSTLAKNKQFLLQCPPAHWHVDCSLNLQYLYV